MTAEDAIARARAAAYGVALEGLGAAFDPDASPLTLLLLVQQETARARELGEAVDAYLDAEDSGPAQRRALRQMLALRTCAEQRRGAAVAAIAAIAEELIAKVAALDEEKAGGTEGETP